MAILNNLIVHGRSRFLNGINANTINADSIGANKGIFNELIATTLDAETATFSDLTTDNATVVGLLDVQGELHTNAWTNANIANIGGSFYISPTVEPTDGTTTISITRNSATSWTVAATGTFATDFVKSGEASSGVTWPADSLVLITGNVVVQGMEYPLGTLKGALSSPVTATAATTSKTITLTGVTDAQNNTTPSVLEQLYEINGNTNISRASFSNGKISLYKLGSYPIGIQMSSMGTSSNSLIDIYGGVSTTPTVRIGHLGALSSYTDSAGNTRQPTGWGIYTDNGYFKGVVVADSGSIGHFTIDANSIYSGSHSAYNSNNVGIYLGRLNSSSSDYYIAGGPQAKWWLKSDGSAQIGAMTLSSAGVLAVPAANITGTLTADQISVNNLSALSANMGTLTSGTISYGTVGSNESFYLSSTDTSAKVGGQTSNISGLRLTVGSGFGVTKNGILYANQAHIAGEIAADTGRIGGTSGWTIASQQIYSTGKTIGANDSMYLATKDLSSSTAIGGRANGTDWRLTVGNGFGVTNIGKLYANGASITGSLSATDGFTVRQNDKTLTTISTSGMTVYDSDGATILAEYTSTGAQIGSKDKILIGSGSIVMKDKDGAEYLRIFDVRGSGNTGLVEETFIVDNPSPAAVQTSVKLTYSCGPAIQAIYINGVDGTSHSTEYSLDVNTLTLYETMLPNPEGNVVSVRYYTSDNVKGYTLGQRKVINNVTPTGTFSFAAGFDVTASGKYSQAFGSDVIAGGRYSHAEGYKSKAYGLYSHAEGYNTNATGDESHAEGGSTNAIGSFSHAEGNSTFAQGASSHSEGVSTHAVGLGSHAGGSYSEANHRYSFVHGTSLSSGYENQAVFGRYNKITTSTKTYQLYSCSASDEGQTMLSIDYSQWHFDLGDAMIYYNGDPFDRFTYDSQYIYINSANTPDGDFYEGDEIVARVAVNDKAFIIGNGSGSSSSARSNALTVDWNGNVDIASGAKYQINGVNLSASDVGAVPAIGGTITKTTSSPTTNALAIVNANTNAFTVDWNGNVNAAGILSAGAISSGLFSVVNVSISVSASSTGAVANSKSVSKTGYYPLGIVGTSVETGGAYSRGFYLTNEANGSCTLNARLYASSSGTKNCNVNILWLKVTA